MIKIEDLSYWEKKSFFEEIDFTIIGAGIVGYSCALHLQKKYPKAKILILERSYLPCGASSKNAGFACFGSITELIDDLKNIPTDEVWQTVEKRWKGLQYLKEIVGEKNLNFQQNGSWDLLHQNDEKDIDQIKAYIEPINLEIEKITGFKNVFCEDTNSINKFGFSHLKTSFFNKLEGQIDTDKMNHAFWKMAVEKDIKILFGFNISSFEESSSNVTIHTNHGNITSKKLIICTNGFASQLLNLEVKPARAQVLLTSPIPNLKIKGTFHYQKGFYYFRNIDQRILLGGGRNLDIEGETTFELKTTKPIQNALEELLREVILPEQNFKIDYRWAGIMGVGLTKSPIIKKHSERVAIGVKMGGMGVAIGSLVGKEIADLF